MTDTICSSFIHTCERLGNRVSLKHSVHNRWIELSWRDYLNQVERTAVALHELGVKPGVKVAILANTRLEWAVCDLAILGLGGVTVPIYQNSTPEDLEFILNNSEAQLLICEDQKIVDIFKMVRAKCSYVKNVICWDKLKESESFYVHWSELHQIGSDSLDVKSSLFKEACLARRPNEFATLIYTSGTTGTPKGVVLTHEQIMSEITDAFPLVGISEEDVTLTFLPYAHVMGRIEMWGHAILGYTMAFAQGMERIRPNLMEIQPTVMIAVPRLFEKLYAGILNQVENSPTTYRIFKWALGVGRSVSRAERAERAPALTDALQFRVAKRLVFDDVRKKMGGRLRFAVSGGAPLSAEIAEFFHSVGVLLLEGYGLTETTAAIAVNTPQAFRFGTVGKPVGDVQIRIADDGEILVKSKKVMKEYYRNPQATAETIQDGWFHTGDIGELSKDGYLRITDRKKELIKTAGGKYVVPLKLENLLKAHHCISQVFIHGDRRKYVVALLTLNPESVKQFARSENLDASDLAEVTQHPKLRELVRKAVAETNSHLASFESIKGFAILKHELTVESGELTPSLKIKRKFVEERYHDVIEALYS